MNRIIFLTLLILSACQSQKLESPSSLESTPKGEAVLDSSQPHVAKNFLISAEGIGKAKLGMTLRELKQISEPNTEFELISPFLVDVNAIAVSQEGLVQYYILYPAGSTSHPDGSTPTDDDPITILMTDNHNYQTPEGVNVGTSIEQAEDIYGDAILAYNVEGESREYITFGDENPQNIRFRASYFKLISNGLGFSGIYPEYPGVSYTTNKYQEGAAIAAIEVACKPDYCLE
ncbi:MAG: hypothetical protein AAGA16_04260 [Cyanobacteria bacterium P01_E01_bin.35]